MIIEAHRVSVSWTRDHMKGPHPALLVCAYDDEERCRSMRLPDSITLRELNERLPSLSKDQELVFICG